MVNVECFIVFCSSRLGRVLVISIRRFAKAYLPICKKRCKVISFSPYNDAVATHFNFASDRTHCLLAFYNNCVITQFPQHLQSVTSTLLPHRSPLPSPFLSSRLLISFVPSPYPFCPIYLPSLHLPSLSQRHQKQSILLPSIRGGEEQPIGLRGGGASFPPLSFPFYYSSYAPLSKITNLSFRLLGILHYLCKQNSKKSTFI